MFYHRCYIVENEEIILPNDLRANLNIGGDMDVFGTLMVNDQKKSNRIELLLSPIDYNQRNDLWIIQASFHDRVGLINELSNFLKDLNLDIVFFKSTVMSDNQLYIKMLVNAQHYISSIDKDYTTRISDERNLKALKAKIFSYFIEDVIFSSISQKPHVLILKNDAFNYGDLSPRRDTLRINGGKLLLTQNIINMIKENIPNNNQHVLKDDRLISSIVAEPQKSVFRICFFYKDTGIIHIRVKSINRIGTIAAITDEIKRLKFNIIQMFSRNIGDGKWSFTDFILENFDLKHHKDFDLKNYITDRLNNSSKIRDFNWEITFPEYVMNTNRY